MTFIYDYIYYPHILQALDDFTHVVLLARVWSEWKVHIDSSEFKKRHFHTAHIQKATALRVHMFGVFVETTIVLQQQFIKESCNAINCFWQKSSLCTAFTRFDNRTGAPEVFLFFSCSSSVDSSRAVPFSVAPYSSIWRCAQKLHSSKVLFKHTVTKKQE